MKKTLSTVALLATVTPALAHPDAHVHVHAASAVLVLLGLAVVALAALALWRTQ